MRFRKGISGNPQGKPKGLQNKTTKALRMLVTDFLKAEWKDFLISYKKLKPRERVLIFEKMLKYGLPTLQSTTISKELEGELCNLTDEQLEDLVNKISKQFKTSENG